MGLADALHQFGDVLHISRTTHVKLFVPSHIATEIRTGDACSNLDCDNAMQMAIGKQESARRRQQFADCSPYPPISGSRRDVPAAPMFAMEEITIGQELEGKATANIPAA